MEVFILYLYHICQFSYFNFTGAASEETSAILISTCFDSNNNFCLQSENSVINSLMQIDLVPTLALLYGIEIPKDNLGNYLFFFL